MNVRRGHAGELTAILTVLDAGNLDVSSAAVRTGLADGRVFVAVEGDRVLGALLLVASADAEAREIDAVAVRPGRRGQGIGTALVRAAADCHDRLVANFDAGVRPFWVSLGFEVESAGEPGRFLGRLEGPVAED